MVTLIVWNKYGTLHSKYDYLTLRELGIKLTELSNEWVLTFNTVREAIEGICCTMEVTMECRRDEIHEISEHMDSDMERGIEF